MTRGRLWRHRDFLLLFSCVILYLSPLRAMRDLPDRPAGLSTTLASAAHT